MTGNVGVVSVVSRLCVCAVWVSLSGDVGVVSVEWCLFGVVCVVVFFCLAAVVVVCWCVIVVYGRCMCLVERELPDISLDAKIQLKVEDVTMCELFFSRVPTVR